MSVHTVRLDQDADGILQQLIEATGLSISALFKRALLSLRADLATEKGQPPYEIYKQLDLGPGGYSIAPSTETRHGVKVAIQRKLGR